MAKHSIKLEVDGKEITIRQIDEEDYISLTDMVSGDGKDGAMWNWLRNRDTIEFLGTWEKLYNPNFKVVEFDKFLFEAGSNRFRLSAKKWIENTGAIGIIVKRGRGGGTYAHRDIAFEFGSWISPTFRLLLIKEFQRLKEEEIKRLYDRSHWDFGRFLSKLNYDIHTSSIKEFLLPRVKAQRGQEALHYADEADLLNLALFGQTARQWREEHPEEVRKGLNIRDTATIEELAVLANLESLNAVMIEKGAHKEQRFELLQETAVRQLGILARSQKLQDRKQLGD